MPWEAIITVDAQNGDGGTRRGSEWGFGTSAASSPTVWHWGHWGHWKQGDFSMVVDLFKT